MNDLSLNYIERLREISQNLDSDILAEYKMTLFPGWDEKVEGTQERLIREAARAILAQGISPDEGTYLSQKKIAALLHYIADMME